jgi:hypothetical protein
MHNCEEILGRIYEYINAHDIDGETSVEIRVHLEKCRCCFDRFEFEQRLLARLRAAGACACPDSLKKRIQKLVENF